MPDSTAVTMETHTRSGPALSATSDTPTTPPPAPAVSASAQPRTVADVVKPIEAKPPQKTEEVEEKVEKVEATEADPGDEAQAKKDKTEAAIKGEITKERNRRRAAEERASRAETQLSTALKSVEQLTNQSAQDAATKINQDDPRPKRDTFDNPEGYDSALVEWSTRQATRAAKAESEKDRIAQEQKATEKAQDDANAEIQKQWLENREKILEEHPDFDEEIKRDDIHITMPMSDAIIRCDNGPFVAYHLAKHPEEAERIAGLPIWKQGPAILKLSVKIETKPPEVSRAPKPIVPVGSRSNASRKTPDEESMAEYAARRQTEIRAARTTGLQAKPS